MVLHELNELTVSFGRRIPSVCRRFFVRLVHSISAPSFLCSAGAFHHRAAVSLFGRCIPSPRHGLCVRPAHLIAAPHSLCPAGASHRRAAPSHFGRRIPSPCQHCLPRLAHPIAMPPSPILVGASHRCTALSYFSRCISSPHLHHLSLGLCAHSMPHCKKKYQSRDILHASASATSILMRGEYSSCDIPRAGNTL